MKPTVATSKKYIGSFTILAALIMVFGSQASFAVPASGHLKGAAHTVPLTKSLVAYPDPAHFKPSPAYLALYKREPNSEIAFWKAANYLLSTNNVVEIRNFCEQAKRSHPHWATPYYILGKLADYGLDDAESAANYRRAFELSPNWPVAALGCVQKLILCDKPREAIPIADAGIKICAAHIDSNTAAECIGQLTRCKAEALYNLKDYAAAAQTLETIQKRNRLEPMEKQLATCYKASNQWAKCFAVSDNYLKDHPDNEDFRLLRAQAYAATGQWQKAVDDLTANLSLHRPMKHRGFTVTEVFKKKEVLLLRAQMYEKLGRKDLAKKDRNELNRQMTDSYQDAPFQNSH